MSVHTPSVSRISRTRRATVAAAAVVGLTAGAAAVLPSTAAGAAASAPAATSTSTDPFYTYSGTEPLSAYRPGAVLKTRSVDYTVAGLPVPVTVVQVLYRSTNARHQAIAAVTSVVRAAGATGIADKVVAYQSFYDSLNPEDGPSRSYATDSGLAGLTQFGNIETALFSPLLLAGYPVVVADTEGPAADFAAGPEYGMVTLDSLRAVSGTPATHIAKNAQVGLIGYSGGAIATNWAAALAQSYAPDVNRRIVGAAEGGIFVDPDHNLHYISGSLVWAGVMPMAIIGVARAYGIDLEQYMNAYGKQIYAKLENASITAALGAYPGLTWQQIALPKYPTPESVPVFVRIANELNLGSQASPTVPMFMGQGADGVLEGTNGLGVGDGVMVAGDVRALARQYCAAGTQVTYQQYDLTSHLTSVPLWLAGAVPWLLGRLTGQPATDNCATIAAGNSLAPIK